MNFPSLSFFDSVFNRDFVMYVDLLLKHQDVGGPEGITRCCFEENFNEADYIGSPQDPFCQPFKGVRFSFQVSRKDEFEYEVVDEETFQRYLKDACQMFLSQRPEKRTEIIRVFAANGLIYQESDK